MKILTPMHASVKQNEPAERPEPTMRFTYPSGSRPLEGYTIKRGVGRGGFGEVYFAVSDAGKEVALKLIRRNLEVELRGVTHCLNLKHSNLVALYDIRADQNDDRWVVMEYVSGESLDEVIDQHPHGMPIDLMLHWFHGICAGVGYLHDHGIVHRDMKPANLFRDEETVKIGDYGLSKFISCSRRSGQTESVGTVHYMAPEIANGRYGREIDIYALGIILYEMLTGHVPFEGESVGEVLMKHLTADPDLSGLAEPYQGIVRRTMAKDPEQRVKSVSEIRELLPPSPGMAPIVVAAQVAAVPADSPRVDSLTGESRTKGATRQARQSAAVGGGAARHWASDEEPIWASLRSTWSEAKRRFRDSPMHPFFKALIGFAVVSGLVISFETWVPLLFSAGFCYLIYRAVRAIVVPASRRPSTTPKQSPDVSARKANSADFVAAEAGRTAAKIVKHKDQRPWKRRRAIRQHIGRQLTEKSVRQKATELCGSMIVAAVIASIVSVLASLLVSRQIDLAVTIWIALVGTLSSWAVMIPAKIAEGHVEDQSPMRFIQLVLGAVVGVFAWGLAEALMLQMPVWPDMGVTPNDTLFGELFRWRDNGLRQAYQAGAIPVQWLTPQMFIAYFAFLFVLMKWWRHAELVRGSRVNLWGIAWCGFIAWGLHFFWWFPQPLGMLLAVVIAFAVQLSSPWLSNSRRQAILGGVEQKGAI